MGARCDYGLYVGASADNYSTIKELAHMSAGLKMYLNETFTTLRLDEMSTWMKVRTLKAPVDWRRGLYSSKSLKNMCSKSCLVQSKKQPLDVAKLVEARWPGLRTEYWKLQQGFEGLYDFFCCEGDASMCFNAGGDKDPDLK